mmetsp:Transcript_23822/g.56237  ORF Transcript_23822/g.56237 Transcript_23822/m.56237 type:complete len:471 (-) Transcript_23822:70-1482(-)
MQPKINRTARSRSPFWSVFVSSRTMVVVMLGTTVVAAVVLQGLAVLKFLSSTTSSVEQQQQQHPTTAQPYQLGPIFYNVYIPKEDTNGTAKNSEQQQKNAVRIVLEQMKQRNMSTVASTSPLWYVQIGAAGAGAASAGVDILEDNNQWWCQPNCFLLQYLEEGGEVDTLQHLWEYCHTHQQEVVTYIHNKGAFHPTTFNEKIRRRSTKAAFDCRSVLVPLHFSSSLESLSTFKLSTNVCAGRVSVLPQYLSNGNMWSAKCNYISQLIQPKQYESSLRRMYEDGLGIILPPTPETQQSQSSSSSSSSTKTQRGNVNNNNNNTDGDVSCLETTNVKPNHLGLGRFAFERWVWSHPDVIPADVFPSDKVMEKYDRLQKLPDWGPNFRRSFGRNPKVMGLSSTNSPPFSKLEGRLYEWDYLYRKRPPQDSWIWKFYSGYDPQVEQSMKQLFSTPGSYCGTSTNQTLKNQTMKTR